MSSENPAAPQRPPLRSLLFVPGTRTDWLPKARAAGADAVILDLEDAVPQQEKAAARARVAEALAGTAAGPDDGMAHFVRINPLDGWTGAEELRALARPGLAGIVLPKVRCAQDVRLADRLLTWCEHEQGLPPGKFALVPLLETARALHAAYDIAAAAPASPTPAPSPPRVVTSSAPSATAGARPAPRRRPCAPASCWTSGRLEHRTRSPDCGPASPTWPGCAPSPNRTAPSATRG